MAFPFRSPLAAPRARRVDFYRDIPRIGGVTTWLYSSLMSAAELKEQPHAAGGFCDESW